MRTRKTRQYATGENAPSYKHGMYGTGVYSSWSGMHTRCYNEKHSSFAHYGGRGISICPEWKHNFTEFYKYMGDRPEGTSIDRFPNKNGNYEPGNCRWSTYKEQANNRRRRAGSLSEEQVQKVRGLLILGIGQRAIADIYSCSQNLISLVNLGRSKVYGAAS